MLYTNRAGSFSCPFHALPCAALLNAPAADGARGSSSGRRDKRTPSSPFHLPAEFFHPVTAVLQGSLASGMVRAGRHRLTSPASWASLRSPGANSRVMGSQVKCLFRLECLNETLSHYMDKSMPHRLDHHTQVCCAIVDFSPFVTVIINFHFSKEDFHQILEHACRIFPFSQRCIREIRVGCWVINPCTKSLFQFIPKIIIEVKVRVLCTGGHSCSFTPSFTNQGIVILE